MTGSRRTSGALVAIAMGGVIVGVTGVPAHAQSPAESLSASFRKAAQRVQAGVVSVRPLDGSRPGVPFPFPLRRPAVPGNLPLPINPGMAPGPREPGGSGVVIDADRGQILTTERTLQGAAQALVVLPDGRERLTSLIRRDPRSDLALLIVDPHGWNLSPISWGDPAALEPGDWVIALGQSGGSAPSLSAGIVSTRRRFAGVGLGDELIETDAVIHSANSGGPLVNLRGEVVGINRQAVRRQDGLEGMGWAIPADRARRIAEQLIQFGEVRRAHVGVQVDPVDPATADRLGQPGAVMIIGVAPGSPAAQADLRPGDVLLRVGDRPVEGIVGLQRLVEGAPVGEELRLTIERRGDRLEVKVRPQAVPPPAAGPPGRGRSSRIPGPFPESRRDVNPVRPPGPEPQGSRRPDLGPPTEPIRQPPPESSPRQPAPAAPPPVEPPDARPQASTR